jgi:hypothetical protein
MVDFLRKLIAFPFYVLMVLSLTLVYFGQALALIFGLLGPLVVFSDPITFVFMTPFCIFEWCYKIIHPSFR